MPTWNSSRLIVYHGTDSNALGTGAGTASGMTVPFNPNLAFCRPNTDFGQGFYTTTNVHQAEQWANTRVLRSKKGSRANFAVVLQFGIDRDLLAATDVLSFVRANRDFCDFVTDCRNGFPPHQRNGPHAAQPRYDVVFGLVTLWRQILTIADCDQISFHTARAIALLPSSPTLYRKAPGGASGSGLF